MQADDCGNLAFIKMAPHSLAHLLPEFRPGVRLCDNGLSERPGDVAALCLVLGDFKDDLLHGFDDGIECDDWPVRIVQRAKPANPPAVSCRRQPQFLIIY